MAKQQTLKAKVDEKLDQALQDSFPASDPVSFLEPVPAKDGDQKLPVIEAVNDADGTRRGKGKGNPTGGPR